LIVDFVDYIFENYCVIKKEDFIKSLTNKPFKIPIPNYQASNSFKSLGTRRQGTRQPLHDPEEENALILYSPPEISATDMLKVDK
jgi:DNA repair and recombination RAD54-like protein